MRGTGAHGVVAWCRGSLARLRTARTSLRRADEHALATTPGPPAPRNTMGLALTLDAAPCCWRAVRQQGKAMGPHTQITSGGGCNAGNLQRIWARACRSSRERSRPKHGNRGPRHAKDVGHKHHSQSMFEMPRCTHALLQNTACRSCPSRGRISQHRLNRLRQLALPSLSRTHPFRSCACPHSVPEGALPPQHLAAIYQKSCASQNSAARVCGRNAWQMRYNCGRSTSALKVRCAPRWPLPPSRELVAAAKVP